MKTGKGAILVIVFLLFALSLLGIFNFNKPRILVLHSADRNSMTAKKMDEGIRRVLDKNRQPISTRWHYLGIDTLPDEAHRQDAAKEGKRAIEQFDPDLIIAVDDEAQEYVAKNYAGRTRPKLVFTAIDHDPKEYGYVGAPNVTGVMETLPLAAIRDTLLQARQGQATRLAVLGHPGQTGLGQVEQVKAFNWAPLNVVSVQTLESFTEWQTAIKAMDGKADALLVLSYEGLHMSPSVSKVASRPAVVHWIEENAKPLPLGISVGYVEDGGGLSVAPSPLEMGEVATGYALSWLKAKPGEALQAITNSTRYRVAIRGSTLQTRKVSLPSIYIEAARLDQLYYP
ncbi:hypothetical protein BH11PSE11_BH11PSE11_21270 [soil metagenome]